MSRYFRNFLSVELDLFRYWPSDVFLSSHCENGSALIWAGFMLSVIPVLSSCANQILLQTKVRQRYFDFEVCFQNLYVPLCFLSMCTNCPLAQSTSNSYVWLRLWCPLCRHFYVLREMSRDPLCTRSVTVYLSESCSYSGRISWNLK